VLRGYERTLKAWDLWDVIRLLGVLSLGDTKVVS
jgi:hypothetical protein